MKALGRITLLFWLLVLGGVAALNAQNAQVSGQIVDPSNAVVSGAKVTLTRVETGDQRENTSGNEGYYSFPLLLPGHYELRVEKDGFQSQTHSGIVVLTANISTVDVALKVGSDTETVNVDASVPPLQTESSSVANVVENASITNLPLVDRRSAQLQRLNGFVVQTNSGASASFTIAGGRSNNADYSIDGGSVQNLLIGVPILIFDAPVESVQEFNVALSSNSAELGRSGGGVIQMTTKSRFSPDHHKITGSD